MKEHEMLQMTAEDYGKPDFYRSKVINAVTPRSLADTRCLPGWRCQFKEDFSSRRSSNWQHSDHSTVATFAVSSAITTGCELEIELPQPWCFDLENEPPVVVVHAPVCSTESGLRVEFRAVAPTGAVPEARFFEGFRI